ncbi:MAG: 3-deoxy-D-manno-octulosonic acid transferase [Bacteroidales bacterium]|nr:MAG: 3-deoxy-D-manno-octulosonic acid transferase [Bacteroidales bacterium]
MVFLYSLGLRFYYLLILLASLFNRKARLWIKGRKGIFDKIQKLVKPENNLLWFHTSSLGEFEQGRPLIEALKNKNKSVKILLTFFSPSGYENRKNYKTADYIFYLPPDTRRNARKFLELIKPVKAFFIKYEFWYHYLNQLKNNNTPVYLISANFRQNQVFFKWYGSWFRKILYKFTHIFVQNKSSEQLLKNIGLDNITISGDTRFDRVAEIAKQAKTIEIAGKFKQDNTVIIGGSTWEKDEEILVEFINISLRKVKYIIAPHEIHETGIQRLVKSINKPVIRYSTAGINNVGDFQVLIIDNIGMLSSLYKYADIAYIGGGFGVGIHNILEAATFGLPVVFGPNYKKFQEAVDLVRSGGAFSVDSYRSLKARFEDLLQNIVINKSGKISKEYVLNNQGATGRILNTISDLRLGGN